MFIFSLCCNASAGTFTSDAEVQGSRTVIQCDPFRPVDFYPVPSEFKTVLLFNAPEAMQELVKREHFSLVRGLAQALLKRSQPACGSLELQELIRQNNLAIGEFLDEQTAVGLKRLESALNRYNSVGSHDNLIKAAIKINQAAMWFDLENFEKTTTVETEALALLNTDLVHESLLYPIILNNIAITKFAVDDDQTAINLSNEVIGSSAAAIYTPELVRAHSSLGDIYEELGNWNASIENYKQAINILERQALVSKVHLGVALNGLGNAYLASGQNQLAFEALKKATDAFNSSLGKNSSTAITANADLAMAELALGNVADATHRLMLAYSASYKLNPSDSNTTYVGSKLVDLYSQTGQFNRAIALEQEILTTNAIIFGWEHSYTTAVMSKYARDLAKIGKVNVAITVYKEAIANYEKLLIRYSKIDRQEGYNFKQTVSGRYQELIDLLLLEDRQAEALQIMQLLKEDELLEYTRGAFAGDGSRTHIDFLDEEKDFFLKLEKIVPATKATGNSNSSGMYGDSSILKNAISKSNNKLTKLVEITDLTMRRPKGADVIKDLTASPRSFVSEKHVALVQYIVSTNSLDIILSVDGRQIIKRTDVRSADLKKHIWAMRQALRDPTSKIQDESQSLYQILWAPILPDLTVAGVHTVQLQLDGDLRYLPFGTLYDGSHFLIERYQLAILTSATTTKLTPTSPLNKDVVGFGVTRGYESFPALPGVRQELEGLSRAEIGIGSSEILLDEKFVARSLKELANRGFYAAHVASHFQFSPSTEANSFLLLGDGKHLTLKELREDNYRFDNVNLLTLSACDTGLGGGRDANGREIEGFGAIAQRQGAKTVVASLWRVADTSTASLMAKFYEDLRDRSLPKSEALRLAQISLLSDQRFAHPFYWGPFIMMGDWH